MSYAVNWNSKVAVEVEVDDGTEIAGLQSNSYVMRSVQNIEPLNDTQIEPQHSINNENIGYLIRPTMISINIGVLAARSIPIKADGTLDDNTANIVSDSEVIVWLLFNRKEFTLTISDADGAGRLKTMVFKRCRIGPGRPGTFTPDGLPISNWTLRALDWETQD